MEYGQIDEQMMEDSQMFLASFMSLVHSEELRDKAVEMLANDPIQGGITLILGAVGRVEEGHDFSDESKLLALQAIVQEVADIHENFHGRALEEQEVGQIIAGVVQAYTENGIKSGKFTAEEVEAGFSEAAQMADQMPQEEQMVAEETPVDPMMEEQGLLGGMQ